MKEKEKQIHDALTLAKGRAIEMLEAPGVQKNGALNPYWWGYKMAMNHAIVMVSNAFADQSQWEFEKGGLTFQAKLL